MISCVMVGTNDLDRAVRIYDILMPRMNMTQGRLIEIMQRMHPKVCKKLFKRNREN